MPPSPEPSSPLHRIRTRLRRATPRLAVRSLASQIILAAVGITVATSLAVTLTSTSSIESFLRAKIEDKLPTALRGTGQRLDLWYSQRRLDVETFGRSSTLVDNAAALAATGAAGERARSEVLKYLDYVLDRFPQYEALFVLDAEGREVARVGREDPLPRDLRRSLAEVSGSRVGDVRTVHGRRVQVASAPLQDARGRRLASLHALVRLEALVPVLQVDDLAGDGAVYVVDRDGRTVVQGTAGVRRAAYPMALPDPGQTQPVRDYTASSGEHVVGGALRLPRFGWTLVVEEPFAEAFAPVASINRRILAINLGIVAVFGLVAYQFARSIVRPLQALAAGARRIAEGETGVVVPLPSAQDEIETLTRVFNEMSRRLQSNQLELEKSGLEIEQANQRLVSQNQELQRMNEMLEQLSITDDLTRLHNHRFFQEQLRREVARARRTGEPLSLALIDVDHFKRLNDRHGHAAGDALLRQVGEAMNGAVRESDLLARYGGEEFALIAPRTDRAGAVALGEKLRAAVAGADLRAGDDGERVSLTVSVGVAELRDDEKALFSEADRALYRAKAAGRDCVVAEPEGPGSDRSSGP